jgi:hypothetical protein
LSDTDGLASELLADGVAVPVGLGTPPGVHPPGHGAASDGHAYELAVVFGADGELAADGGEGVPVILSDELVRLAQVEGNGLQADVGRGFKDTLPKCHQIVTIFLPPGVDSC